MERVGTGEGRGVLKYYNHKNVPVLPSECDYIEYSVCKYTCTCTCTWNNIKETRQGKAIPPEYRYVLFPEK